ncbi:hypothetical protein [Cognatishimia sp. MH4019]|uniref:hypothetical protein n=1 Tax=Cognatishimia sp. MH4019 TaxID=2854030 RepID=UPI001CD25309|nr:hypothetical protein [Cognatishimia sp. MH4019]
MEKSLVFSMTLDRAQSSNVGLGVVELHKSKRKEISRRSIVKITNTTNGHFVFCSVIGNDRPNEQSVMRLDLDQRKALGAPQGRAPFTGDFEIKPATLVGRVKWFVSVPDPFIRTGSQIAVISLVVGLIGFVLGLISLRY